MDEALRIKNTDLARALKLPPVKLHCSSSFFAFLFYFPHARRQPRQMLYCMGFFPVCWAVLAEDAIQAAIKDFRSKQQSQPHTVAATA